MLPWLERRTFSSSSATLNVCGKILCGDNGWVNTGCYKSNKVMFHNENLICVPFLQTLHSYYFAIGMVCGTGNAWERTQLIQVCSTMQSLCLCSNKWKRKVTAPILLSSAQWRKSTEYTQALMKVHLLHNEWRVYHQMKIGFYIIRLIDQGEIPSNQMKEHWDRIHKQSQK